MEDNINWNLASNTQLKEECERLERDFETRQTELKDLVEKIDTLNNLLVEMSKSYNNVKNILNKREGKI